MICFEPDWWQGLLAVLGLCAGLFVVGTTFLGWCGGFTFREIWWTYR